MEFVKSGMSAIGKLFIVIALAGTFFVGMVSVFYLSLIGEEVEIPKVVGKNVNEGEEELASLGLRMQKFAYRYSNEQPNTILEQRPKAGEPAKSGLMVSVILSKASPDGNEAPIDVKGKEQETKKKEEEIKELPELETEKAKTKPKKTDKKSSPKTRDVIDATKEKDVENGDADKSTESDLSDSKEKSKSDAEGKSGAADKNDKKDDADKTVTPPSPKNTTKPTKPVNDKQTKPDDKPKTAGETRSRRVPPSN